MEISFLGQHSFKIKTKTITLITDPVNGKEKADVVIYSGVAGVVDRISGPVSREKTFVIDKEGEYELGGVGIIVDRIEMGKTGMLVRISVDGVVVADTAGLSIKPEDKLLEKISEADILMVSLDKAKELVRAAEPFLAILMGYQNRDEVEQFLASHKFEVVRREIDKLKIDSTTLPENTEVVVLNG
jgi:hypothetical protein